MVDKNWTLDEFLGDVTGIPKKDVEKIYQMYQNTQHKRILPERAGSIYADIWYTQKYENRVRIFRQD